MEMNRSRRPRLRSILLQILLFVGVSLGGLLPYGAAMWVFHNESLYYRLAPDPRFRWMIDFVDLVSVLGPIPCLGAGMVLGIFTLFCFNDLKHPKLRE